MRGSDALKWRTGSQHEKSGRKRKEKKNRKIPQTHVRLSRRQSRPPGALKNRWCSFLFHSIGLKEIVLLAEDEEETGRSESNAGDR
jgi:hypothetical protein